MSRGPDPLSAIPPVGRSKLDLVLDEEPSGVFPTRPEQVGLDGAKDDGYALASIASTSCECA
jgi:hypothetical protein